MPAAQFYGLQEFNRGLFDFLIATDDTGRQEASKAASKAIDREGDASEDQTALSSHQVGGHEAADEAADDQDEEAADHEWAAPMSNAKLQQETAQQRSKPGKDSRKLKAGKKRKRDQGDAAEYGVTRGVDFRGVKTVINVDAPSTVEG